MVNEEGIEIETSPFSLGQQSKANYIIVKRLIKKAGLDETTFLRTFETNGVSDINMGDLTEDDVNNLFKTFEDPVYKSSFYNALVLWRIENPTVFKTKLMVPPKGFNSYKENKHSINIQSIMEADIKGQKIISFFNENKSLDEVQRKRIITVVIDFLIQCKIWIEKKNFKDLTNKILAYFNTGNPNEYVCMFYYYSNHPQGNL